MNINGNYQKDKKNVLYTIYVHNLFQINKTLNAKN